MNVDLHLLGSKVKRYREQFLASLGDVAASTGLSVEALEGIESARRQPTGDEILILSDYFRCDFKFFLSAEDGWFPHTEAIFERAGNRLTKADRWAIQEFLYFCDNEERLRTELAHSRRPAFQFQAAAGAQDERAPALATALRRHLGYEPHHLSVDLFSDLRRAGFKVFRRALASTGLLGLFVRDRVAGLCLLVNCANDLRVQRVAAAHIAGQALLDDGHDFLVSYNDKPASPFEAPPGSFASHYLAPREFLAKLPKVAWTLESATEWSDKLVVPRAMLISALVETKILRADEAAPLRAQAPGGKDDEDPELGTGLPRASRLFRIGLVTRGLSPHYVKLCFDAHAEGIVSEGRLAELLLVSAGEVDRIATVMGYGAGATTIVGDEDDDAD